MEFRKFEFTEFFYFRKHKFPSKKFQIPKLIFWYEISGKIPFQEQFHPEKICLRTKLAKSIYQNAIQFYLYWIPCWLYSYLRPLNKVSRFELLGKLSCSCNTYQILNKFSFDFVPLPLPSRHRFRLNMTDCHRFYPNVFHHLCPLMTVNDRLWSFSFVFLPFLLILERFPDY